MTLGFRGALPPVGRVIKQPGSSVHIRLMIGPPGSGKSMLAQRLPGLLPPLDPSEALEVSMIHSVAGVAG